MLYNFYFLNIMKQRDIVKRIIRFIKYYFFGGRGLKNRLGKINQFLEMPEEITSNKPKITILGFEELVIENYKNILEYEEIFIKVNTYIGAINISGINLKLIQMNKEDIMITGKIDSIDFEEIE